MRRILRASHDQRRRASLKSDEENLIQIPERRHSNSFIPPFIDEKRRKSVPANVFLSGNQHNHPPKSAAHTARRKLRRFLTIKDDAFEHKYLVAVGVICTIVLLIIILSLYQLIID